MERCAITYQHKIAVDRLYYLFLIFLTGCLVGWVYEEIFYWIAEGALQNRGVLYGPWLPIYGIGALGIYALKPMKEHPTVLFLLCVAVTGVVEYSIGYVGIHVFGLRLWDYRGLFLNLDGIICFRSVVCFGFMGLAFHYLLEPICEKLFRRIPEPTLHAGCLILAALFVTDCVLSALFRTPITY